MLLTEPLCHLIVISSISGRGDSFEMVLYLTLDRSLLIGKQQKSVHVALEQTEPPLRLRPSNTCHLLTLCAAIFDS